MKNIDHGKSQSFTGEYNGTYYGVNDTWSPSSCLHCKCDMSGVVCEEEECSDKTCDVSIIFEVTCVVGQWITKILVFGVDVIY